MLTCFLTYSRYIYCDVHFITVSCSFWGACITSTNYCTTKQLKETKLVWKMNKLSTLINVGYNKVEKYGLLHKLDLGLSMIGGMGEDAAPTWERWRTFIDSLEGIPKKKFVPSAARANQYDANRAGFISTSVKVILWLRVHGFSVIWWTDWWVKHHVSILANVPLAETQLSKKNKIKK